MEPKIFTLSMENQDTPSDKGNSLTIVPPWKRGGIFFGEIVSEWNSPL